MAEPELELSEVIAKLRASLATAQQEGEKKNIRFVIDEVEVEFQVVITKEAKGGAGIRFWVLDAKAEGDFSNAATQKIKLRMKVVDKRPKTDKDTIESRPAEIMSEGKR